MSVWKKVYAYVPKKNTVHVMKNVIVKNVLKQWVALAVGIVLAVGKRWNRLLAIIYSGQQP